MDQLLIPKLSENISNLICKIVEKIRTFLDKSTVKYQQPEELLLTELGLKGWQPTEDNMTVKSLSLNYKLRETQEAQLFNIGESQKLNKF